MFFKLKLFFLKTILSPKIIISFIDGEIMLNKGKVRSQVIWDLQRVITENQLNIGYLYVNNSKNKLIIFNEIPDNNNQQIRNIWLLNQ
jgi:Protein of unknown function (DUF3634)